MAKKHRFLNFVKKFYVRIPKNYALMVTNKFNGKTVKVFNGPNQRKKGKKIMLPWLEGKLIALSEKVIDYPKTAYDDSEGQSITVDFTATVRISDVEKYEYAHQNIEEQLKSDIYAMTRVLIKQGNWEELSNSHFSLPPVGTKLSDIAQLMYDKDGNEIYLYKNSFIIKDGKKKAKPLSKFEVELIKMREKLDDFADKYGLEVVSFQNKDVQQSEEMQKAYDEKVRVRRVGTAQVSQARYQRDADQISAEGKRAFLENELESYIGAYRRLEATTGSPEVAADIIRSIAMSHLGTGATQSGINPAALGAQAKMGAEGIDGVLGKGK